MEQMHFPGMRMLRTKDVLRMVGVSKKTLYRMIERGEFPERRQLHLRAVGWPVEEVNKWLAERQQRAS